MLADLDELHKDFVLVPTDKAKNNITIVCKKFYISMIEKELSSNTFSKINRSEDYIINEHKAFLLKHRIKFDEDNSKLPYLYITPKQHKKPVGVRYITSGSGSSLQQLAFVLNLCFTQLKINL